MEDEICSVRHTKDEDPELVVFAPPLLAAASRHQRILLYSKWRGRPPTKRSGCLEVIDPIVVMAALADSTSYLLIDFLLRGHSERNCQGTARRCPRSHRAGPHRRETPGTIVIDTDNRYLYLVEADRRAIRYGVTVGEEAQGWSGVAKVGSMAEWPGWTPTPGEQQRLGPFPAHVPGGPQNPMGARGLYLYADGKDTLYRIHGTNQPEYSAKRSRRAESASPTRT
jgi:L,D-transpeptidase catalytic domain